MSDEKTEIKTGWKWVPKKLVSHGHVWEIGKWYSVDGEIKTCGNGFHASTRLIDVMEWVDYGMRLFRVEYRGDVVDDGNKIAAREMRLVEEVDNVLLIMKRFARLCARQAARHVRAAMRAARDARYVSLDATRAAWDAIRAATRAARDASLVARDATRHAALAAWAARHATLAARHAARDASRSVDLNEHDGFLVKLIKKHGGLKE